MESIMGENSKESLKQLNQFLENPEELASELLWNKERAKSNVLRETCRLLFGQIENLSKQHNALLGNQDSQSFSLSSLDELFMGDSDDDGEVDAETLWGQVSLQNDALYQLLKASSRKIGKAVQGDGKEIRILGDIVSDEDAESDEMRETQDEDDGDVTDEETLRIRARMERAMQDMESDSENDRSEPGSSTENMKGRPESTSDDESLEDPAADELNDGFFNINDMEAFADEEEEYLPDDAFGPIKQERKSPSKKSLHQRLREGDEDSDGSDDDDDDDDGDSLLVPVASARRKKYREDDEIEALHSLYEAPKDDLEEDDDKDDPINLTAADIFGKPKEKYYKRWNERQKQRPSKTGEDNDSWDEYSFNKLVDDNDSGWNDRDSDDEGNDDVNTSIEDAGNSGELQSVSQSSHAKQSRKLKQQTEELEAEMLAEKPWQMTGESSGTSRPMNSLLEKTPEFERASKMAPVITVEHTANLEDVIKMRVLNEDWDDIVPRELPDIGLSRKGEAPEVSQEKSKLSLGELYERDYLKKAVGYDVDAAEKESEEDKVKNEMKSLFANLCSKLDALSNYHFAPRPVADEAEIRTITKPAIAMEEVIPLHVSDARAAAPEEVYGAKRGREAILRNESELDKQDRKRARSSKKAARRKARKEKQADEKLISRLQPGLGLNNPFERRKMQQELSEARAHGKVTEGKEDQTNYSASTTFFKRMQEEAEQGSRDDKNRKKDKRKSQNSSSLML